MKTLISIILLTTFVIFSESCKKDDDKLITPDELSAFLTDTPWGLVSIRDRVNGDDLTTDYANLNLEFLKDYELTKDKLKIDFTSNIDSLSFRDTGTIEFPIQSGYISDNLAVRNDGAKLDFYNIYENLSDTILEYNLKYNSSRSIKNTQVYYEFQVELKKK